MSSEWRTTTVGEICAKVFSGGTPTSTNCTYYDGGTVPWLRTKEVNYCRIYNTEEHITELGIENSSVKLVPVNSVIVAMYGNGDTAGRVAINKVPLTTNQACCNLVVDACQADYRFVYYYLMGQYKALVDLKNGGAQQNLNSQLIKAFPIALPGIAEQVEISALMEALDDRITLLRETNTTLEAIAQALFKSWFVDFDPVRAKMEGRAPEGMIDATAALFPDGFKESALGLVPRGWRVGKLVDLANLNPESWTARNQPARIAYIDLANTKDNEITSVTNYVFDEAPSRARRVLRTGDTIVGTVRPGNRSFAFIHEPTENLTGSTGFAVLRPSAVESTEFVFLAATQDASIEHLSHVADGGAYPAVRPDVVAGLQCVIPDTSAMNAFHAVVEPLLVNVSENQKQAQTLATLRDTLLPRLISGALRLPHSEEIK